MIRSLVLLLLWLTTGSGCVRSAQKESVMNDDQVLNARQWGDLQNRSYLPVGGRLGGTELWSQPPADSGSTEPVVISIIGSRMAVWYGNRIELRQLENGRLLWSQETLLNCSFEVASDGFPTVDDAGYLRRLGFDGKIGERIRLPLVASDGHLHFVRDLGNELRYCYQLPPHQVNDPTETLTFPEFAFARAEKSSEEIAWILERQGFMVTAMISPDGTRGAVAGSDTLYLFELPPFPESLPDEELDIPVKEIAFDRLLTAAYDHEGNILVIEQLLPNDERPQDELVLRRLSPDGTQQWELSLGSPNRVPQPPASFPDGEVCVTIGSEVRRVRDGVLLWSAQIPVEPGTVLLTLLNDGSLLAAAGSFLIQFSAGGEEIARVLVDDSLTCRPIMDREGKTYVAGVGGLRCFK